LYVDPSIILEMVAGTYELPGYLTSTKAPTRRSPRTLSSVTTTEDPDDFMLTRHFTNRETCLILASQKAPLYLAETSVPMDSQTGSSPLAVVGVVGVDDEDEL